jgi:hypothetical protein
MVYEIDLKIERYWVNQPSISQSYHNYNGMRVLAFPDGVRKNIFHVYLVDGPEVIIQMPRLALSKGWPKEIGRGE